MDVATCSHQMTSMASEEGCVLCYLERLRHEEETARWPLEWHRRWEWERVILCPACSDPGVMVLANGTRACRGCGYRW